MPRPGLIQQALGEKPPQVLAGKTLRVQVPGTQHPGLPRQFENPILAQLRAVFPSYQSSGHIYISRRSVTHGLRPVKDVNP